MKTIKTWLKRAAMLSVTVAFAAAGFGANAATGLTLNDGDTLTGVYEDYEITIAAGATVTFNGATITHTSGSGRAAIDCAGNATIVLAEGSVNGVTNTVNSCAAIHPATNATLTIRGSGSLDAYSSGDYGAGIGAASARSNANPYPCGNIVIEGGTITAQGGSCGAGVGAAAWSSPCGDITITGNAVVTASSGQYAAAIGAASDSSPCGNITISGNASVTAKKDAYQNAAGIGACHSSPCRNIVIDTTKFQAGELHFVARRAVGMHGTTLPGFIDAELHAQLITLKSGARREAYLADLASRLPPNAVASARNRLDEAIAYAEKLFNDGKVIGKDDFEKRDVQKSLLARELNAGNPVKPIGNFQLPANKTGDVKKCTVTIAKRQSQSLFMRDLYGKVHKPDWFK